MSVRIADLTIGEGRPVAVLGGPLLVELSPSVELDALAGPAVAVVVDDLTLVRAAARLALPVILRRPRDASLMEWLTAADRCEAEGNASVVLCEAVPDLALVKAARAESGRPVIVDLGKDAALAGAAVAAGADGLLLDPGAPPEVVDAAVEDARLIGAVVRPEAPEDLPQARAAIDRTDAALAVILERRAELAGAIQRLKPVGGFAGRDPERERKVVAAMAQRAPRLGEPGLRPIMAAVIEAGLHAAEREWPAPASR